MKGGINAEKYRTLKVLARAWGLGALHSRLCLEVQGGVLYDSSNLNAPNVKIIPPLVYLAGLILGSVVSIWISTTIAPRPAVWTIGALLIFIGVGLAGSAIIKFKLTETTIDPTEVQTA